MLLLILKTMINEKNPYLQKRLKDLVPLLQELAVLVQQLVGRLSPDRIELQAVGGGDTTESRVIESDHPYHDNENQWYEVKFSGADELSITFDPQTRCEGGCAEALKGDGPYRLGLFRRLLFPLGASLGREGLGELQVALLGVPEQLLDHPKPPAERLDLY